MSTVMPRSLGAVILMLAVTLPLWPQESRRLPQAGQGGGGDDSCGPPLPEAQIVGIVHRAIRITGGDPTKLEEEYQLSIHPSGCDYIVIGVRQPETIAQEFAITIDRSGRVKSWPWCCVPEFEVGPLQDADYGITDPSIVITDGAGRHLPVDQRVPSASCTPAFFELQEPIEIPAGAWTISFRLLAVGCAEDLGRVWPPSLDRIEQAFIPELQEPHPIQTLLMIRDHSPEMRARLTKKLNEVLKDARANDVFLFDAKGSEH
jgi:hypothetical protein